MNHTIEGKVDGTKPLHTTEQEVIKTPEEMKVVQIPPVPIKLKERVYKWILTYYHQKGKFPSMDWLVGKVKASRSKVIMVLRSLEKEGRLERVNNRYYVKLEGNKDATPNAVNKVKAALKVSPVMMFLKLILFIIGCGATYMSIFHSIDFFSYTYGSVLAVLAGSIMVGFNICAAELTVYFFVYLRSGLYKLFFTLWVLGTIFSMVVTVIGMYNGSTIMESSGIVEENRQHQESESTNLLYDNLLERKLMAKLEYDTQVIERQKIIDQLSQYTIDTDIDMYNNLSWQKYLIDIKVFDADILYKNILTEETTFLQDNTIKVEPIEETPPDAYTWIAERVFKKMSPDTLQFLMSIYPSIFYDIIAPVSLSIVFFSSNNLKRSGRSRTRKKRKRKK